MYSQKQLSSLLAFINSSYLNGILCVYVKDFKGCLNFLKKLESEGLISAYVKIIKGSFNHHYLIYLRYNVVTGIGVMRGFINVNKRFNRILKLEHIHRNLMNLHQLNAVYIF
jgi:ribosomal protein S8